MLFKYLGLALVLSSSAAQARIENVPCGLPPAPSSILSVESAVQKALQADLRPNLARAEIAMARSERAVAALKPVDSMSFEVEDFPGFGIASDIDNLQMTGSFSRVWERGGKREARQAVAAGGVSVAETGIDAAHYHIEQEIETLYLEGILAEAQLALSCERVETARQLYSQINIRIKAARDPLLAGARVQSDVIAGEAKARRLMQRVEDLKIAMASYWGGDGNFDFVPGFLAQRLKPRSLGFGHIAVPELDRLEALRLQALARTELERTKAVPDVTWNVGLRKFGVDSDVAVVGGFSIPLGSANRSRASVMRALADQQRISLKADATRQQLNREALVFQRAALRALDSIEEIDAVLLPQAKMAIDLAQDGYARGAFTYLDIIEAQGVLTNLRETRLAYTRNYILNEAALARLMGREAATDIREDFQP